MIEVQIDTLVGPTHFYGGLAYGNIASMSHRMQPSNPKKAALEGLEKMKLIHDLGVPQLILPPHMRPKIQVLRSLGYQGSDQKVLENVWKSAPTLLLQCSSQSAMWTANVATVTPSSDTNDGKVHITCANLCANLHRSLEVPFSQKLFKKIFGDTRYFVHHTPLPATQDFADEGAANHTRFVTGPSALHFFVYGRAQNESDTRFPARQTKQAQEAIQRRHGLSASKVVFAQQSPHVIDQGVFHNDVIAVGHESLFIVHEEAYVNARAVLAELQSKMELDVVLIKSKQLSIKEAVSSYLFNSQLVTSSDGEWIMLCPTEVLKKPAAKRIAEELPQVARVMYVPINQSMKNGGGPACLRLRLPLEAREKNAIYPFVFFSDSVYEELKGIINHEFCESFTPKDLLDPEFRRCAKKVVLKIAKALQLQDLYEDE